MPELWSIHYEKRFIERIPHSKLIGYNKGLEWRWYSFSEKRRLMTMDERIELQIEINKRRF